MLEPPPPGRHRCGPKKSPEMPSSGAAAMSEWMHQDPERVTVYHRAAMATRTRDEGKREQVRFWGESRKAKFPGERPGQTNRWHNHCYTYIRTH